MCRMSPRTQSSPTESFPTRRSAARCKGGTPVPACNSWDDVVLSALILVADWLEMSVVSEFGRIME